MIWFYWRYTDCTAWFLFSLFPSNSARFLWKTIPSEVRENKPEIQAAWKIGQKLWIKDYGGVHEAIREFNWSPEAEGIVTAFSGN